MGGLTSLYKVYKGEQPLKDCKILYIPPVDIQELAKLKLLASMNADVWIFDPPSSDLAAVKIAKALSFYSELPGKITLLGPRPTTPKAMLQFLDTVFFGKNGV